MKKFWFYSIAVFCICSILTVSCKKEDNTGAIPSTKGGLVIDVDGNVYSTIVIGSQTWMVENLKVTKYRDGTAIPNVTDNTLWKNLTTGGYCIYNNSTSSYGCLYNYYAVSDSRNIAPTGWRVPTEQDWAILVSYLGGENVVGGVLKETGTTHWLKPNTNATNVSGFTGLPGGIRNGNGLFFEVTYTGYWWSSTSISAEAYYRSLIYNDIYVGKDLSVFSAGLSIRCVRDN